MQGYTRFGVPHCVAKRALSVVIQLKRGVLAERQMWGGHMPRHRSNKQSNKNCQQGLTFFIFFYFALQHPLPSVGQGPPDSRGF